VIYSASSASRSRNAVDTSWINPLISGLSGVGGAGVGAGALLRANRRDAAERRAGEHRAALIGVWTAANSVALLYTSWGATLPERDNWFARTRHGIQAGGYAKLVLTRLLDATDRVWEASGRLRTVATAADLEALDAIETVLGDWQIGDPMPDAWGPAIRQLRVLLEAEGGTQPATP
jgi:hypothetical protein